MRQRSNRHRGTLPWAWSVLIALTLWRVWIGPVDPVPVANAQIPDSAAQRNRLIEEIRRTNQLLTQIDETLHKHTIKVRVVGADNTPTEKSAGKGR